MNRPRRIVLVLGTATAAVFLLAWGTARSDTISTTPPAGDYVPNQVIVKFKPGTGPALAASLADALTATVVERLEFVGAELWDLHGMTTDEAVRRYQGDPRIEYIEPNYRYRALDVIPNDDLFSQQWALHNSGQTGGVEGVDIDAPEAWEIETGDPVLIGIIDTGVDDEHWDLDARIYTNPGEIAGNRIDDDGNGYVDDVHGWNFAYGNNNPDDDYGHGTHVAGIAAAAGNDNWGIAGVAWNARILPIKFLDSWGWGTAAGAIKSIDYATMMGTRVINNSWGGFEGSQALKDAIARAGAAGVIFVAAAGNDALDTDAHPVFPAAFELDNIISVAATDASDRLCSWSNWGLKSVDLGAPGDGILSTIPHSEWSWGWWDTKSGTSTAAPHVAGAAVLLWSYRPRLTALQVKGNILKNVFRTPALEGKTVSGGRLNLFNMLTQIDTIPPALVTDLSVTSRDAFQATLQWTATGDFGNPARVMTYDVRFSTQPIDATNFHEATRVPDRLEAGAPGETESLTVHGLQHDTPYCFALKVVDTAGNLSEISNVVVDTTLDAPQLVVLPGIITASIFTGETEILPVVLANAGEGTLEFEFPAYAASRGSAATPPSVDPTWMSVDPAYGRVPGGESLTVYVSLDASGLDAGSYMDSLTMRTNVPIAETVFAKVDVQIMPAPQISMTTTAIEFGDVYAGFAYTDSFSVKNIGSAVLEVSATVVSGEAFTVDPAAFSLQRGESRSFLVTFDAAGVATYAGALRIVSNDPFRPVVELPLSGRGVSPPSAGMRPREFAVTLFTGGASDHSVMITNSGDADLEFSFRAVDSLRTTTRWYTLPGRRDRSDASASDGKETLPDTAASPSALTAELRDLSGVKILWDRSNGQLESRFWSVMINDLRFRGAVVEENFAPLSAGLLGGYHLLWLLDCNPLATDQIAIIRDWVSTGGVLLIEGQVSIDTFNEILLGTGVAYQAVPAVGGESSAIFPHYITEGVKEIYFRLPEASLAAVDAPAGRLVNDRAGRGVNAHTRLGLGDIVVIGCPMLIDSRVYSRDNRLFGNRAIDWLVREPDWIDIQPSGGTVAGHDSLHAVVRLTTSGIQNGRGRGAIILRSNDIHQPSLAAGVSVTVLPAPDVACDPTAIDFGKVFVTETKTRELRVKNPGVETLVVHNIVANHPYFSVDTTAMSLYPGEERTLKVSFHPLLHGPFETTLSISSNDPDEAALEIPLRASAIRPQEISASPTFLRQQIYPGVKGRAWLEIANTGEADLTWSLSALPISQPETVKPPRVLYDRSHGQEEIADTLISALAQQGIPIDINLSSALTGELLSAYDVLYVHDVSREFSKTEKQTIEDWVAGGGSLLVACDEPNAFDAFNVLFGHVGVGIRYRTSTAYGGAYATDIEPHFITSGIDSIFVPGANADLVVSAPNGRTVMKYINGKTIVALSEIGATRIIAMSDELDYEPALATRSADNLSFFVRAIQWLVFQTSWLSLSREAGVTPGGKIDSVEVTFETDWLNDGVYEADIQIDTDAPAKPTVVIPAFLTVMPASDISLPSERADFGSVYTNVTAARKILVTNAGSRALFIDGASTSGTGFRVDPTGYTVLPGQTQPIEVRFKPSYEGRHLGLLKMYTNDPDERVPHVYLEGVGIAPPHMTVSARSLGDTLLTGLSSQKRIAITNTGKTPLTWQASFPNGTAPQTVLYTLVPPASPPFDPERTGPVVLPSGEAAQIPLADLSGVRVMYDRAHDQADYASWSTIVGDLRSRGAVVEQKLGSLTDAKLAGYDVFWTTELQQGLTPQEISSLARWVRSGGSLLLEGDNDLSVDFFQMVLDGLDAGMSVAKQDAAAGVTTRIAAHSLTFGVDELFLSSPGARVSSVWNGAIAVVEDTAGVAVAAIDTVGSGRIFVVTDEQSDDARIGVVDNQLFSNRVFDWLADKIGWISVSPDGGSIASNDSSVLTVTFDAHGLKPGEYRSDLTFTTNDPEYSVFPVPTTLTVEAAPDIVVSDTELDFDTVFVNTPTTRPLIVTNEGVIDLHITSIDVLPSEFSVSPETFTVAAGDADTVIFAILTPVTGSRVGVATLHSDDPDDPALTISLRGVGVHPPRMIVSPDSLDVTLIWKQESTQVMSVANEGEFRLEWQAYAVSYNDTVARNTALYTLSDAVPAKSPSEADGQAPPPPEVESVTAKLLDLAGLRVMYDRSHKQPWQYETMASDLRLRGASVIENTAPITRTLLETANVFWIVDGTGLWQYSELYAISDWVRSGGALLLQGDESYSDFNTILAHAGSGIRVCDGAGKPGVTGNIIPHATTVGVHSLWLSGPQDHICEVSTRDQLLVRDASGGANGAASDTLRGRVVVITDELFADGVLDHEDNRVFGNRVFDWLASVTPWLSVTPDRGTVRPDSSQDVTVSFHSSWARTAANQAVIHLTSNDPAFPDAAVPVRLFVIPVPDVALLDTVLAFGPVMVGQRANARTGVTNDGVDTLVVTNVSISDTRFQKTVDAFSIAPRDTQWIDISFVPDRADTVRATMSITSDDYDEPVVTVALEAQAVDPPRMVLNPPALFDTVSVGQTSALRLAVRNTAAPGAASLVFEVRLNAAGELSETALKWLSVSPTSGTVTPGDSTVLVVTLDARDLIGGVYTAEFSIASNIPGAEPIAVPVTMVAIGIPRIVLSSSALDFGTVYIGYPATRLLNISNEGSDVLAISAIYTDDVEFSSDASSCTLAVHESRDVSVTCSPVLVRDVTAHLTIVSNDPANSSLGVNLSARCLEPPVIVTSPDSLFLTLPRGDQAAALVRVENTGRSDLDWSARAVFRRSGVPLPAVGFDGSPRGNDRDDNEISASPSATASVPLSITVRVLWHGVHDPYGIARWSEIIGDIEAADGAVVENTNPLTPELLADYQVVWLGNATQPLSTTERTALTAWVRSGGALLIEAGETKSQPWYQVLLNELGSGIRPAGLGGWGGYNGTIYPHPTTAGVSMLKLALTNYYLIVSSPAVKVVDNSEALTVAAAAEVATGRIMFLCGQVLRNDSIEYFHNRLFANQVFDWLRGGRWLSIIPERGTLEPDSVVNVSVNVDASGLPQDEWSFDIEFTSNDPATPMVVVPLTVVVNDTVTVALDLDAGWNLRSWYVDNLNDSLNTVLAPVLPIVDAVVSYDGGPLMYTPSWPPEMNTLHKMDHLHGYWILVRELAMLPVTGPRADPQTPIALSVDANAVSYLARVAMPPEQALAGIIENVRLVQGFDAEALAFDPTVPPEFNTLRSMRPGYGYYIYMNSPDTLVYPTQAVLPEEAAAPEIAAGNVLGGKASGLPGLTATREWINVWARDVEIDGERLPAGEIVTATDGDGVLCGAALSREGAFGLMPIYRDDPGTAADEGVSPGEELTIAVGHLGSFGGVRWTSNGDVLSFSEAAFLVAPTSEQAPRQYALYQNYPNPFNPTTSIRYDIARPGHVEIVIFTVRGERVRTLVAADQGAGRYTVSWDGKNADGQSASSGVYLYRLVSSGFSKTCKMVLLR